MKAVELVRCALETDEHMRPSGLTLEFEVLDDGPVRDALLRPCGRIRLLDDETRERILALVAGGPRRGLRVGPAAVKVIFNDPATVVYWFDGTRTVSKVRGGDEYDPVMGVLVCAYRKVAMNRSIDAFEDVLTVLARLRRADDLRAVAGVLMTDADLGAVLNEGLVGLSRLEGEGRRLAASTLRLAADALERGEA